MLGEIGDEIRRRAPGAEGQRRRASATLLSSDRLDVGPVFAAASPDGVQELHRVRRQARARRRFYTERTRRGEAKLPPRSESERRRPDGQVVTARAWAARAPQQRRLVTCSSLSIRTSAAARVRPASREARARDAGGDEPLFYDRRLSINAAGGDGSALRLPLFLKQPRRAKALWERALGKTAARLDEEDRVVAKAEI